jgi:hypothetical protein
MFYGIYTPNFGAETTPRLLAELVAETENAGWDGFFLWDHILYNRKQSFYSRPVGDPARQRHVHTTPAPGDHRGWISQT